MTVRRRARRHRIFLQSPAWRAASPLCCGNSAPIQISYRGGQESNWPFEDRKDEPAMNPLKALQDHGQAVWLDFLSRGFITKGGLKKLADEDGLRGVTSNPSIFEHAIGHTDEYDDAVGQILRVQDRAA